MNAFRGKLTPVRALVLSSLFCALISVGAYIKIPFFVPITLQLLFLNTAALLLGRKWGVVTAVTYIFLGLAGLPVFSFGGGIGSVLSPSFGFVLVFIPGAFFAGWINERFRGALSAVLASAADMFCVYLCGTLHFVLIKGLYLSESITIWQTLCICVLPFILPDVAKLAVSILLYKKLKAL